MVFSSSAIIPAAVTSSLIAVMVLLPSSSSALKRLLLSGRYYYRSSSSLSSFLLTTPPALTRTTAISKTRKTMASSSSSSSSKPSTTSIHYERHQTDDSYEKAYFYEPGAYMEHLSNLVRTRLGIGNDTYTTTNRILDIGGGTGNFARSLLSLQDANQDDSNNQQKKEIIVVDPFLEPTTATDNDNKSSSDGIHFVKEPAEAFLQPKKDNEWWRQDVSQILLKEVVHHLDDRAGIFQGMYHDLNFVDTTPTSANNPSILIITRPQIDIDYPLWDEARAVWKENQPSTTTLKQELESVGLINIQSTIEPYPCSIPLSTWQSMIQNRFWSTFSNFSNQQLEEASMKQIPIEWKDRVDDNGILHFEDRLVFISAQKVKTKKT